MHPPEDRCHYEALPAFEVDVLPRQRAFDMLEKGYELCNFISLRFIEAVREVRRTLAVEIVYMALSGLPCPRTSGYFARRDISCIRKTVSAEITRSYPCV
jgi:hypothetical protein